MGSFLYFIVKSLIELVILAMVVNAILSWLIAFDVVNMRNRFIYQLTRFLDAVTRPILRPVQLLSCPPLRRRRHHAGDRDHPADRHRALSAAPDLRPAHRGAGLKLAVRLTPRGGRDAIEELAEDEDRPAAAEGARSRRPAGRGARASAALVRTFVAKALGLPRSAVRIASGDTARVKVLEIDGLDEAEGAAAGWASRAVRAASARRCG